MARRHDLALCLGLFVSFNVCALAQVAELRRCPARTFKPYCTNCTCSWNTTDDCDAENGQCLCKDGFKGQGCDEDINECFTVPGICGRGVCINTHGSHECTPCPYGFQAHSSGSCDPCPGFTYGLDCKKKCKCVVDNTLYCDTSNGECICLPGWETTDCGRSVDDCKVNDCPEGSCEDQHLHYVCVCGDNHMVIGNTCQPYRMDFISLDKRPAIGEWVDIYMFFSLPDLYYSASHLAPELIFRIFDDQSEGECWTDFKVQSRRIQGREPILSKIKMPRRQPYQSYIHFKTRFFKQAKTKVTAYSPSMLRNWELVFDARYKSNSVQDCLEGMTIPGTEMKNITKVGPHSYERQVYLQFEIVFAESKDCFETPRVIWDSYYMDVPANKKLCLAGHSFEHLNIDAIAKRNRELPVSDHHQPKEIVIKNTLPLGIVMLCVTAYVQRSISRKAVACGFIKVVPSWIIMGKLWPSSNFITTPRDGYIYIRADYEEPDMHSKLKYEWICREPEDACKKIKFDVYESTMNIRPNVLQKWLNYYFEAQITIIDKPWKTATKNFTINVGPSEFTLQASMYCMQECNHIVSGLNVMVVQALVIKANWYIWSLTLQPLDESTPKVTYRGPEALKEYRMEKWDNRYFFLKVNSLPPGHKVILEVIGLDWELGTCSGRAEYEFETMKQPVGKGCNISPTKGKAVFTKFTITCKDYKDVESGLPLIYKLYQEVVDEKGEIAQELVGYSNQGVIDSITLSSDSPSSKVNLNVKISTVFQIAVTVKLKVKLSTGDQRQIIAKTIAARQTISTVGSQEELRLVKDVATIMKASSSVKTGMKKIIRKQLMQNMKDFEAVAGDTIEHSSTALMELASRDDEVDDQGLDNGLKAAERITKYLGKCGAGNFATVKDVASLQVSAMSNLVKVSSSQGKGIENAATSDKERLVKQGKENSRKTISSMSQIVKTLRGGFDSSNEPIKIKKDTMEVVVESKDFAAHRTVKMNSDSDSVGFSISSRGLNFLGNGSVETEFEVYDKSPFTWTSDHIHGDIPVMKVNFVEPFLEKDDGDDGKGGSKKKVKRNQWQFSKPADVFLKNRNIKNDSTEHSALLFVNKYSKKVYMSSCIYLSVLASTEKVTILEVSSEHNLTFKVKARYTNTISAFDLLTDYDMMDIPLNTNKDEFTTVVGNKTLKRLSNFIFFPKLTKKHFDVGIPYYNVKISVKKGQKLTDIEGTAADLTAKEFAKLSNLTVDVTALTLHNITVEVINQQLSCVYFDQKKLDYSYDSCELSVFTTKEDLHCRCVVAAAFSASYLVMPRLIDPTNIKLFAEIFNNPLTVSMVICVWLTFLALFLWGRRKDIADEIKRGATVLADNREENTYVYLLCVVTGNSALAGTTSNVYIFFKGTWSKSHVHVLCDSDRALFTRGAENWFVMTTDNDLGYLKSAVIWTDYSGGHPSWFLQNIHVQNVQTGEAWNLRFNSWLSASKGSGHIIAEISAKEENVYSQGWYSKITGKGKVDIRNDHLWFGMVFKTAYNKFTRFRRLATALSMLQMLMILNLMFYGIRNVDDSRQYLQLFGFRIHLTSVIIGFQSCLIMSMFGIGLSFTFNRIMPKKDPPGPKSPDTLAEERAYEQKKKAITLAALQTYMGDDVDGEKTDRILNLIAKSDENKEDKSDTPKPSPASDLWFTLPWWFLYIYWGFLVVYNLFVAYYIMLYGLSLGYEKSVNWVVSFFSGFAFNVLLVQPLKVIGMVVFLVLVFKQTYTLRDMAPVNNMVDASIMLRKHIERARTYTSTKISDDIHRPPSKLQIGEILKRLAIEMSAREMLRDLCVYSTFLAALIVMTYRHTYVNGAYYQTRAMNKMLFQSDITKDGEESSLLDDISTVEDIWSFIGDNVLPFLTKEAHDNLDINSFYFTGTARIRQVRVERDTTGCDSIPVNMMEIYQRERCTFSMYDGKLETRHFNLSWHRPIASDYVAEDGDSDDNEDDDDDDKDDASIYQYNTAGELNTAPIAAPRVTYPGGGYVLTLPRDNLVEALSIVEKSLAHSSWLDHLTRCLFVEFTMYNPDSNLFTHVVTGFEFDENGGPYPFKIVSSSRLYHYTGDGYWTKISEIVVMVCSAFYTVIVAQNLMKGGLASLTVVWNWVDILILGPLYVLAYCIYRRDASMVSVLSVFAKYGNNHFLDFQDVFHKDYIVSMVEGFAGGMAFLKLIYVTRFNPFFKTFTKSVDVAKEDVFGFTVMTILFMIGFSLAAMIIFGRHMASYTSLDHCLLSLLFFIMGEAEFHDMVATNKVMGPIFFLIVMMVTQYVILNLFLAMIRDGMDMAMSLDFGKKDATIRYMLDTIKLYLGIGSNRQTDQE